ncbi:MAG: hypothetical protein ABI239_10820 [Aquihabitans sp.]
MAGTTHHIQRHMAAVGAAPSSRWSAIDGFASSSPKHHLPVYFPKTVTTVVKPSNDGTRRVLEGSS